MDEGSDELREGLMILDEGSAPAGLRPGLVGVLFGRPVDDRTFLAWSRTNRRAGRLYSITWLLYELLFYVRALQRDEADRLIAAAVRRYLGRRGEILGPPRRLPPPG